MQSPGVAGEKQRRQGRSGTSTSEFRICPRYPETRSLTVSSSGSIEEASRDTARARATQDSRRAAARVRRRRHARGDADKAGARRSAQVPARVSSGQVHESERRDHFHFRPQVTQKRHPETPHEPEYFRTRPREFADAGARWETLSKAGARRRGEYQCE